MSTSCSTSNASGPSQPLSPLHSASPYNRDKGTIFLVLEFCEHDLAGLLSDHQIRFPLGEIKKLLSQLFNGLYFIHQNKVLHRDMKASNILITKDGVLKLADFGLARMFSPAKSQRFTNRVVTLWYRPPEILLGDRHYGPAIDLWGAGCVMAEMWTRSPILQGSTEQHQLELISILCGSISPEVWPGVESLELFTKMKLPEKQSRKVKDRLRHHVKDHHAVDLLERLLTLDPKKRIDCDGALNHDFFWTDPMPSDTCNTLKHLQTSHFEILAPRPRAGPAPPPQPATHLTSQVSSAVHDRVY